MGAVDCDGKSGGLVLFWASECCVHLQSLCKNFIDMHIKEEEESGVFWRASFVYGEPKLERMHIFWNRLHFLRAQWEGPWVCIGDFNELSSSDEHLGPTVRGETQMHLFIECGGLPMDGFGFQRAKIHLEKQTTGTK